MLALMRKSRRCFAQDQCSKNADFCHFGLFWQNPGYRTKIHKFDIPAKCSTFYECTFFSTFFPTCFEKKGSFFTKKVTFTPKKKHFFRLYLQRAPSVLYTDKQKYFVEKQVNKKKGSPQHFSINFL